MQKLTKGLLALILSAGLCLGLAACAQSPGEEPPSTEDAALYVDGLIREYYLGEFDPDYLELVGIQESGAETAFQNNLGVETQYFFSLYEIEEPTQALYEEVQELYRDIYSHTRYEILSAVREEDGAFSVEVQVEPIDIIRQVAKDLPAAQAPWFEKYPSDVQSTMTAEEWEAADQEWSRIIVDLFQDKLAAIGHLEPRQVTVRLEQDDNGLYEITDESFSALNDLVIDYQIPEETPEPSPSPSGAPEPSGSPVPEPPTTASPRPTGES